MPFSNSAIVALTSGELALEGVDAAVQDPPWPWGISPGLEFSEDLGLASEGVDELVDFEVGLRENFTLLSPPHLEDPLLVLIFGVSFAVAIFTIASVLISPANSHWVAGAPRKGHTNYVNYGSTY